MYEWEGGLGRKAAENISMSNAKKGMKIIKQKQNIEKDQRRKE